ncbi:MAG: hypothetical protein ABIU29_10545, partial [Chthoniobacterales bacterium]
MKTKSTRETKIFQTLRPLLAMTLLVATLWNSTAANAARVRIDPIATVTVVDDRDNLLNNSVSVGDTITGTYVYDSTAVDSNQLPEVGDYHYTTGPNGIRLNLNGMLFATDPAQVDF